MNTSLISFIGFVVDQYTITNLTYRPLHLRCRCNRPFDPYSIIGIIQIKILITDFLRNYILKYLLFSLF